LLDWLNSNTAKQFKTRNVLSQDWGEWLIHNVTIRLAVSEGSYQNLSKNLNSSTLYAGRHKHLSG